MAGEGSAIATVGVVSAPAGTTVNAFDVTAGRSVVVDTESVFAPAVPFVRPRRLISRRSPPFTTPLEWTIVPLAVIPSFAFLIEEGWRRRREAQWHKRLMLGASILVVFGPGFTRIPLAPPTFAGFFIQLFAGMLLLFAPLFIWDRKTTGRIHPATWTALCACAVSATIPMVLMGTHSWAGIAAKLPGVGS